MPYCVKADLESKATPKNIIRWADDDKDGALSTAEDATITDKVEEADALIDMRLDGRYDVPFTTVPTIIRRISINLAIWFLASRRGFASEGGGEDRLWQKNFSDSIKMLNGLQAGTLNIPGVAPKTSIRSTEKDVQAALTYTKQDQDGDEIETDLDNSLDDFLDPPTD